MSKELKEAYPVFVGIAVYAEVKNTSYCEGLREKTQSFIGKLTATTQLENIKKQPVIATTREVYKRYGKDPGGYHPSAEALCRRLVQGIVLYRIDTLVDLINLASPRTGHSVGSFDAGRIAGTNPELGIGKREEPFEGVGRGVLNVEGLPIYHGIVGGIGTPTSNNGQTKMDLETTRILAIVNGYNGKEGLQEAAGMIQTLLRRCAGSDGGMITYFE